MGRPHRRRCNHRRRNSTFRAEFSTPCEDCALARIQAEDARFNREFEEVLRSREAVNQLRKNFLVSLFLDVANGSATSMVLSVQDVLIGRMIALLQEASNIMESVGSYPLAPGTDPAVLRVLLELSQRSQEFPAFLSLDGIISQSMYAVRHGGYSDVFIGRHQNQTVALKRPRATSALAQSCSLDLVFLQEALLWWNMRHRHVLPLLGVDHETFADVGLPCMVSPWVRNGTVLDYLGALGCSTHVEDLTDEDLVHTRDNMLHSRERERLLAEAAAGLAYMHSRGIVHGDLRGANILVDDDGRAVLADFGLAKMRRKGWDPSPSSPISGGSVRFMAPELLAPCGPDEPEPTTTFATDVFAFGCVCLEVYTLRQPFHHVRNDWSVMHAVMHGERPGRPSVEECFGVDMPGGLWSLVTECWAENAADRPCIGRVALLMDEIRSPV